MVDHRALRSVPDADEVSGALQFRTVHGYRRAFRIAGEGPPLLLIHGIGDSSVTWQDVIGPLSRRHLVIAPDLLGHGASARPRADYTVAAYANGMRDLLGVLGVDRVTVVGHSLGGGVAMQFAYQFPDRTDRLVLVSSGGLGREVHPALRLASLPGADAVLSLLNVPGMRWQAQLLVEALRWTGSGLGTDADDLLRMFDTLRDSTARSAFLRTLRAVVDHRGQLVTMLDRCYLARGIPTQLVWGARDPVLLLPHAWTAREAMPGSRLVIFDDAGHFPFHADPQRFVAVVEEFMATSAPADWDSEQWRELLRSGQEFDGVPAVDSALHREYREASERNAT
ncbi:MAG: alpha/beta fold hydrolase [Pseudonocardiaceae bacterium]|nr:alpha/beta fold hydrolase [Pseudonocardiaceae bacterium]